MLYHALYICFTIISISVRIITVWMETADPNLLIGSILSAILNYLIILIAIIYTPADKKLKCDDDLPQGEIATNGKKSMKTK